MEESQSSFRGWAKVEVMGHQSHVGYVKTEAYGAAVLFRIDTPELPDREYVLTEPAYATLAEGLRQYCPAGTKVKRPASPGCTVLVGAGSIYRIIPCSEAVAMKVVDELARAPLMCVQLPEGRALAAAAEADFDGVEEVPEVCDDCGKEEAHCRCSDFS